MREACCRRGSYSWRASGRRDLGGSRGASSSRELLRAPNAAAAAPAPALGLGPRTGPCLGGKHIPHRRLSSRSGWASPRGAGRGGVSSGKECICDQTNEINGCGQQ